MALTVLSLISLIGVLLILCYLIYKISDIIVVKCTPNEAERRKKVVKYNKFKHHKN